MLDGQPHVIFRARSYPVAQADCRKDACGAPRYRPDSRKRDYRNPHPERVAGGGTAAVRSRIQRQIHGIEQAVILRERQAREDREPVRGNSRALEVPGQSVPDRTFRDAGENQSRIRQPRQDLGPKAAGRLGKFQGVVERPECDESVACRRRRLCAIDRNHLAVTPLAAGEPDQCLGMRPIGRAWRVRVSVAKTILDPRESRRVQIPQPRHLHRCRLLSENDHPKRAAVPGQIDENVDSIAVDRLCQTGIGHGSHVTPEIRARTHLLRDLIRLGAGRVAKDLASGAVVPFEQGGRKKRDRVGVEIA